MKQDPKTGRVSLTPKEYWGLLEEAESAIAYVGAANYPDREETAVHRVQQAFERFNVAAAPESELPAKPDRPTSPVVAAFIAPESKAWQSAPINVCADGSWWVNNKAGKWNCIAVPLSEEETNE